MFVISAVFYSTIEYKIKAVEDEITIKKADLNYDNMVNTLERNIDKIVNDAFVNASYKIMNERKFFDNSEDALTYITEYIKNEASNSLNYLKGNENISYSISSVNIRSTAEPEVVNVRLTAYIEYKKKLNNGELWASRTLNINKNVKLSRIPDPYVYLNEFYYTWGYYRIITVTDLPNVGDNIHCIIQLDSTNFDYSHMHNPSSPVEIRIIGNDYVLLPYKVLMWRNGSDEKSLILVECNKGQLLNNNQMLLLYNSTTTIDRQNESIVNIGDIYNTTISEEYANPDYKEKKSKNLMYYGEEGKYIFVNNGSYSIIGLYTNKTDSSWGSVGYKPLIEEN